MRRLLRFFLAAVLILTAGFCLADAVFAETLDDTRECSISLTLRESGAARKPIPGAAFRLYRVGDRLVGEVSLCFAPTPDFADSGLSLENPDAELASELAAYAYEKKPAGLLLKTDREGKVRFSHLRTGLYLVTLPGEENKRLSCVPFLVSLPMTSADGRNWVYHVEAEPKADIRTESDKPALKPDKPPLVQTGQQNWPIPVLSVAGLLLFAAGWVLSRERKTDEA